ncbi:MAG TPA: Xaa-Pro peptidase family protein [Planctomycetaceae bacterium]
MLTQAGCQARRERLWRQLPDAVEWVLVADPRHVHYLANFWVQPISFSFGERGLLLLHRSGQATLLADNFTRRSAATDPHVDREVIEEWYDHKRSVTNRDHALLNALRQVVGELKTQKGIVEAEWLPLAAAEILGLGRFDAAAAGPDVGDVIRKLRRTKEADELDLMRACMRATEAGHRRAREVIRPGVADLDVYREVQSAAVAAAGRPAIVYGDFRANDAKSPKAGGHPVGATLKEGDLFILDYTVLLDGYRSDFTNTYAVGEPSDRQRKLFDACAAALERGGEVLKAGVAAAEVYREVSAVLEKGGFGKLGHHAGHGLGLGHPEPPILVPESTDTLLAGDVVTIEPGAYVEGIGGVRVEHNFHVTPAGCERLSNHTVALTA